MPVLMPLKWALVLVAYVLQGFRLVVDIPNSPRLLNVVMLLMALADISSLMVVAPNQETLPKPWEQVPISSCWEACWLDTTNRNWNCEMARECSTA